MPAIDFAYKTFDYLLEQLMGMMARWQALAQSWTLLPDQQNVINVKVLSSLKSQEKLFGVWILFKSVEDADILPSQVI